MKTAVIGVGVIGNVHMGILLEQGITPVAICDVDESKTAKYPQIKAYTDYKEMLDKEQPDIVHVCTPHYLHAEMVIYALERNINVLCEKPLCMSSEEIEAVLKGPCALQGRSVHYPRRAYGSSRSYRRSGDLRKI